LNSEAVDFAHPKMVMVDCAVLGEEQVVGDNLGKQVGDNYIIHDRTSRILDDINRRLNDEDKTLRAYRRALAFSQMIQKDLVPILVNSGTNVEVFDAVIRLLVNLTVPVECLCPLEVLSKSDVGRQTIFELNSSLTKTKNVFRDSRSTRVIMDRLSGFASKQKECDAMEVMMVNNCLLLIRNILHIPDSTAGSFTGPIKRCSNQNQIMWNLFAQNLDTVVLNLIKHKNGSIWCTSVVQLIALVYKDQHVVTLQKLLQNFLESSLSESSEDNESNTCPQYRNGSCDVTTDYSSDQICETFSRDVVTGVRIRRRERTGSLDVLPNTSPIRSSPPPSPPRLISGALSPPNTSPTSPLRQSPGPPSPSNQQGKTQQESGHQQTEHNVNNAMEEGRENTSSGIDSEIFSTNESEQPPNKLYISENDHGKKTLHGRRSPQVPNNLVHKSVGSPGNQFGNKYGKDRGQRSSSESSDVTGVPKSSKILHSGSSHTNHHASVSSDYGYITGHMDSKMEREQQEMISSSSNEDDHMVVGGKRNAPPRTHPVKLRAKPDSGSKLTPAEQKDKHRLKLIKRSKQNRMRVKATVNHMPSDKDISELLKEFTVDFLHNGYCSLVSELLERLSKNDTDISMDKSHVLWLLTYFLKFASQLEIGLDQIGSVVSFKTLSYITYEGVELLESFELANRERRADINPHLRRMHLVVTALREFIQTIRSYSEIQTLSQGDRDHLSRLRLQTLNTKEIRQLLVLLLRTYNPSTQSPQYLSDLIVTNHMLLLDLEESQTSDDIYFDMPDHVSQFAHPDMMRQYGRLLEDFEQNTPYVNDCIFTVMHHVAGDLDSPQTLYIPSILKSFSKIWEQGIQICDDWVDLIEYIIQKFIQNMGHSPHTCAANMVECLDYTEVVDESGLTGAQTDQLFSHFSQVEMSKDPVGAIIEIYKQTDNLSLTRLAVIQALLSHGIITHAQYMNFIYMKSVIGSQCKSEHEGSVIVEVGSNSDDHIDNIDNAEESLETLGQTENRNSDIQVLKDCLIKQGRETLISWLQECLLNACRVKMYPTTLIPEGSEYPHEPIPFYYNKAEQSIPLVPWNKMQYQGLQTEAFILLLHKLGFHLPADVGKVFPRIPHFWSADHIYTVATRIGNVDEAKLKFSLGELERISSIKTETVEQIDNERPAMKNNHNEIPQRLAIESNHNQKRPAMDQMDLMGCSIESMDIMEEGTSGNPGGWLAMANASKQMANTNIRLPRGGRRASVKKEVDEYMDMD